MAYSDFTLSRLDEDYGLKNQMTSLFQNVGRLEPSAQLLKALSVAQELPVKSEKAKSELIVMPILLELRERNAKYFTIYSGDNLNIDERLKGECDFILSKDTKSFEVNFPILQIVEAKKNDIEIGIPQCAAQMLGAQKYNERKGNSQVVYGCVTTGDDWIFMRLDKQIEIDTRKYYLGNLAELLGVFQHIIQLFQEKDSESNL